jgi:hypothetical protein
MQYQSIARGGSALRSHENHLVTKPEKTILAGNPKPARLFFVASPQKPTNVFWEGSHWEAHIGCSTIDKPSGMPTNAINELAEQQICGLEKLRLEREGERGKKSKMCFYGSVNWIHSVIHAFPGRVVLGFCLYINNFIFSYLN